MHERDNAVVAILGLEFAVEPTAQMVKEDHEVHVWRFDGPSRVASLSHWDDSHRHGLAPQPTQRLAAE